MRSRQDAESLSLVLYSIQRFSSGRLELRYPENADCSIWWFAGEGSRP